MTSSSSLWRRSWLALVFFIAIATNAFPGNASDEPHSRGLGPSLAIPQIPSVLDEILTRNIIRCGMGALEGFASQSPDGTWNGFSVDICRALAAAILGDPTLIDIRLVDSHNRFSAVVGGDIDVLVSTATATFEREALLGVEFPISYLFDGQGFLTHQATGLKTLNEMESGSICVIERTASEQVIRAYLARTGKKIQLMTFQNDDTAWVAFARRRCDVLTNERINLQLRVMSQASNRDDYVILHEVFSQEPLSPAVRGGDPRIQKVVRWVISALISAEELGITQETALSPPADIQGEALMLLGLADDHAAYLGLKRGWIARALQAVGNYGEVFDRSLGAKSPFKLARGQNALWRDGGLMFAPPLR